MVGDELVLGLLNLGLPSSLLGFGLRTLASFLGFTVGFELVVFCFLILSALARGFRALILALLDIGKL